MADMRAPWKLVPPQVSEALYEAEDQFFGRLVGVGYAEIFRSHSPLVVDDPTTFKPEIHGQWFGSTRLRSSGAELVPRAVELSANRYCSATAGPFGSIGGDTRSMDEIRRRPGLPQF